MSKQTVLRLLASLAAAAVLTAACRFGALYRPDNALSDTMYQRPVASQGDIEIIGIDQQSIDELGLFQDWDRSVIARAIEMLNSDPDYRPAAIGIDVLFQGYTSPEFDDWLADAASQYDNVVFACYAAFGSGVVEHEDGTSHWDTFLINQFNEPFPALADAARMGHINAMLDNDGVLRRSLLYLDLPDGRRVPSFNYQIYKLFAELYGLDTEQEPPTDERGFWNVPFTGRPGEYYQGLGVSALINGEIDPGYYADRIVLIGPFTEGLQDSYNTAISQGNGMFGVEYQANCIEALIRSEFKQPVSDRLQGLILFLVSFLCLYWFLDRKLLPVTAAWFLLTAGWPVLCLLLYGAGFILHPLWLPAAVTILYVASVAVNYVRAALERSHVTNTFKKYVAPEIVNELLKQDADALSAGRLTDIAVLFVDIRGFTPMSEILEPTQVVEILNRYLTLTSGCIMNNKGTLDKFIGDATMAFWGAPLPQEDYIYKAVKTAIDMIEGSKAVSEELAARYGRTVSFGIGVHCGKAVVGNIGAPHRMDYTAIGDTVNTAARLESNAPPGQLYISRAVADALEGRIRVSSLGDNIRLKGKSEGFEVLRVDGLTNET